MVEGAPGPNFWFVTDKMDDERKNSLRCDKDLRDHLNKKWKLYLKLSAMVIRFSMDSEVYDRKTLLPILAQLIRKKDTRIWGLKRKGKGRDINEDSLICADAVFPHWGQKSFELEKCDA